jgi:aminoglycoside phosphotransferase (APT) family kinase protein
VARGGRVDVSPNVIVLKLFEHDASLCQKEVDLMKLVGASVPVPELLHAEPHGLEDVPPFLLTGFVPGISFGNLLRQGDVDATAEAAHSAGTMLAAIGRTGFARPGWLGPGPTVGAPLLEGADPMPRFVDQCIASPSLERRVPIDLRARLHERMWSWAPQLAILGDNAHLVHGDFSRRNLLVHRVASRWSVAAVLDWEFAVASSPLADVGNFLRYEHPARPRVEPHFSRGYLDAGGRLPPQWWRLAGIVDLIALCERLTRDELPADVEAELVELCRATVEERDARL